MVKTILLSLIVEDMDTCTSDVVDFGVYVGIAKSLNKNDNPDPDCSESIHLVTKEKELFNPYPWIPLRSKLITHPLDPHSKNQRKNYDTSSFLSCDRCQS